MEFVATGVGLAGVLALAVAVGFAALIFLLGPSRPSNRALAILLLVDGLGAGTGNGVMFLMRDRSDAFAWQAASIVALGFEPFAYAGLIGCLPSPLARPFRHRWVRAGLFGFALFVSALVVLAPSLVIAGMVQPWYAPWDIDPGPVFVGLLLCYSMMSIWSVVVALDVWRRATRGSPARAQARAYAIAFGSRDSIIIFTLIAAPLFLPADPTAPGLSLLFLEAISVSLAVFLYVPLVAYGILRTQVLGIELRLKVGIRRGTVAAVFLALFFVVSQLVQSLATQTLGYEVGAIAAGLLLFALRPIERMASRLADRAVPEGHAEAYAVHRRLALYEAAVAELASGEGKISDKRRAVLDGIRENLALDPALALEAERGVLQSIPSRRREAVLT